MEMDWTNKIYVDEKGIIRWKYNDYVPCDNMLEYFCNDLGYSINIKQCAKQRETEIRDALKTYAERIRNFIPIDNTGNIIDIRTSKRWHL